MGEKFNLTITNGNANSEISKIKEYNTFLVKYGLNLSELEIKQIIEKKNESLKRSGRIEFEGCIADKMIKAFCDSSYVNQENFADTICELIEIFYYYKTETKNLIADDELINFMRKYYDEIACGDVEYLANKVLEKIKKNVLLKRNIDFDIE